jgi:large subunit ribosomal protein L31e
MVEERVYVIPLRHDVNKRALWRRTNKAVTLVNEFIKKHMKTEKVVLSKDVNELLWSRGSKRPPGKIKVKAVKDDKKTTVSLVE